MIHGPPRRQAHVSKCNGCGANGGIIGKHGMVDSGRSVSDAPILAGSVPCSSYKETQP